MFLCGFVLLHFTMGFALDRESHYSLVLQSPFSRNTVRVVQSNRCLSGDLSSSFLLPYFESGHLNRYIFFSGALSLLFALVIKRSRQ